MGTAIASQLTKDGFAVVIADIGSGRTSAAASDLGLAGWFAGDLTDEDVVRDLVGYAAGIGSISTVVNTAGIAPKLSDGGKIPFDKVGKDDWLNVLAVNVVAPFLVIREAAPLMPRDGRSSIVNIGSISARLGSSGPAGADYGPKITAGLHYSASKAAVHSLGVSLSRELAPLRIRVNTIAPGYIATAINSNTPAETVAQVTGQIPSGRAGTPDDIANAVRFLVSDEAQYLNGAVLDINGAWLPQF